MVVVVAAAAVERTGLSGGGEGVSDITGMWTHFWHTTSLPVKVTRSPDGNGCLHTDKKPLIDHSLIPAIFV